MLKRFLLLLFALSLLVIAVGLVRTVNPPGHLYSMTGTFGGCPARPSCVSSQAEDPEQFIEPLRTDDGDVEDAVRRLVAALDSMPQRSSMQVEGPYIHAVFVTPRMRYHDDVELLVREDGRIDVRSVSRFGYRDFGVNRARVEALRDAYQAQ